MKRKIFYIAAAVLAVIALVIVLLLLPKNEKTPAPDTTEPTEQTAPARVTDSQSLSVNLGYGLFLTEVGSYTGPFLEDGSDQVVSGVLMIRVTNRGDTGVEYANISLSTKDGQASFTLSALLPGETVILLETNRLPYDSTEAYQYALMENTAFYTKQLSRQEDLLSVKLLDGGMNVINISGKDIDGDIVVYYKNKQNDIYYGGITYRLRITGGMKRNAISQLISQHIHENNTEILFITVE
ncbi:MAG: hypothetical protein IKU07_02215 [Oscillospiraceae bacterium]|nr:hypothetical protein [Oscillospiraceae bacterium]